MIEVTKEEAKKAFLGVVEASGESIDEVMADTILKCIIVDALLGPDRDIVKGIVLGCLAVYREVVVDRMAAVLEQCQPRVQGGGR